MNMKVPPQFGQLLQDLRSKEVTEVVAGGGNGSVIILKIGQNEFSIFVKCAWRLQNERSVLTGWNEPNNAENGNLTLYIKNLLGDVISGTELSKFFDLKLRFISGKTLDIFCDVTPNYEPEFYDENWLLCDIKANVCYTVSKDFLIVESNYK
jgi:hypothetical protein